MKFIFILSFCALCHCYASHEYVGNHVDITLVGAYGDLAKKYLWKALFQLYTVHSLNSSWAFNVFGAGTKNRTIGQNLLEIALESAVSCSDYDYFNCNKRKLAFLEQINYIQLSKEQDYNKHCSKLFNDALLSQCHKGISCDYQHIFYLSVPPFAYESISSYIAKYCRPTNGTGALKVVFEKPFGHSESSAQSLSNSIAVHLREDEIYRVDHYLGKQTIQEILSFRKCNVDIENLFNSQLMERIEIVMKEKIGVKGRTQFYDKYGVIADVMNNHLSEILYLLTMDLPIDIEDRKEIDSKKLMLVEQITTVEEKDVVKGQYEDYQEEVDMEMQHQDGGSTLASSKTPTFAGIRLHIGSSRWTNLPVIMIAGKRMDQRTGYARLVFKENLFTVNSNRECSQRQEIIFHVDHGPLKTPAILVSHHLPLDEAYIPDGWAKLSDYKDLQYFNQPLSCYRVFQPTIRLDAYEFLVEKVFLGHQEHFLRFPSLLESWRIWGAVVEERDANMKYYPDNNLGNSLDFMLSDTGLKFVEESTVKKVDFLKSRAVLGNTVDISSLLAHEIIRAAHRVVESGRDFHIAFSGGSSPIDLFHSLATLYPDDAVWGSVHIWQVDERCSMNSSASNFNALSSRLIDHVPTLRFSNIHPMPIESTDELCADGAAMLYEKWLKRFIGKESGLDYIVMGVGSDGHIASLFPSHDVLAEKRRLIAVVDDVSPTVIVTKRMTFTYPLIDNAKAVSVIVSGKEKCNLLAKLRATQCDRAFPVCKVSTRYLTWYIDQVCAASIL